MDKFRHFHCILAGSVELGSSLDLADGNIIAAGSLERARTRSRMHSWTWGADRSVACKARQRNNCVHITGHVVLSVLYIAGCDNCTLPAAPAATNQRPQHTNARFRRRGEREREREPMRVRTTHQTQTNTGTRSA